MSDKFKLVGHETVPVEDLLEWGRWLQTADCKVAFDQLTPEVRVSTVFLGLDHSFGSGPPLLFETMIFGGEHSDYQERYSTWDKAEAGHKRAVELACKAARDPAQAKEQAMTLWDRVERWRAGIIELKNGVKDSPSYDLKRMINERSEAVAICASELEADLRELRQRFEEALVSVDMIVQEDDRRALEAFDIAIGPLRS